MVSFTPQLLCLLEYNSCKSLDKRLGAPQNSSGHGNKENITRPAGNPILIFQPTAFTVITPIEFGIQSKHQIPLSISDEHKQTQHPYYAFPSPNFCT
jgi:hypothetical protein